MTREKPQRLTSFEIEPSLPQIEPGGSIAFSVVARDQRGEPMDPPEVIWNCEGGGHIDDSGVYTASTEEGYAAIIASIGGLEPAVESVTVMREETDKETDEELESVDSHRSVPRDLAAWGQYCQRLLASSGASWRYQGLEGLMPFLGGELMLNICPADQTHPLKREGVLVLTDKHLCFVDKGGSRESVVRIPLGALVDLRKIDKRRLLMAVSYLEIATGGVRHRYMTGRVAGLQMAHLIGLATRECPG